MYCVGIGVQRVVDYENIVYVSGVECYAFGFKEMIDMGIL
jgi:hypothetical protein